MPRQGLPGAASRGNAPSRLANCTVTNCPVALGNKWPFWPQQIGLAREWAGGPKCFRSHVHRSIATLICMGHHVKSRSDHWPDIQLSCPCQIDGSSLPYECPITVLSLSYRCPIDVLSMSYRCHFTRVVKWMSYHCPITVLSYHSLTYSSAPHIEIVVGICE